MNTDERLHHILDGDLSPSDAAASEGDLQSDAALTARLAMLRDLTAWARSTRPRAPSSLRADVERRLRAEPVPGRVIPLPAGRRSRRPTWAFGLAAAAVLALALLPVLRHRAPSDGDLALNRPAPVATESPTGDPNTVRYTFQFRAPGAREVCLAGDFNRWKVCQTQLTQVGEDTWTVDVDLPRGRHEYMFVVDGAWRTDPTAPLHSDDGFGNRNAVILL